MLISTRKGWKTMPACVVPFSRIYPYVVCRNATATSWMTYLQIGLMREDSTTTTFNTSILLVHCNMDIFFILNDSVSIKIDPQLINEYKTKW